jgi:hypothetical protein
MTQLGPRPPSLPFSLSHLSSRSRHLSCSDLLCLDVEYTREVLPSSYLDSHDENTTTTGSRRGGGMGSSSSHRAGSGIRYILRGRLREKGKIQATDR